MIVKHTKLADLYEADETAWLDAMADLIRREQYSELDYEHLQEYLNDMSIRERHQVQSRLEVLVLHVLKWTFQPDRRSASWRRSIIAQQERLALLMRRAVLRGHAEVILAEAYRIALRLAEAETELPAGSLPAECPY